MLKVYGYPRTRTIRVTWTLEEIGADYEYVTVDFMKGEARQPPFRTLNPGAKVPLLQDGDLTLGESAAICTYLGDKFPKANLVPEPRTAGRATYDQWCFFAIAEMEEPLWTMAKHRFVLPKQLRVPDIFETARWEFAKALGVLDTGLGDCDFILGDRFSVADILLGHICNWARNNDIPIESSRVNAYADRLLSRPALLRAREKEKSLID